MAQPIALHTYYLRQYRRTHADEVVFAYEKEGTEKLFALKDTEIAYLRGLFNKALTTEPFAKELKKASLSDLLLIQMGYTVYEGEPLLSGGAVDVLLERQSQQSEFGFDEEHDAYNNKGELVQAATCYLSNNDEYWPIGWHRRWWKPRDYRKNLVKAAALLLAEIDRIDNEAKVEEEK